MWDGFDNRKFPRINLKCKVVLELEDDENPTIEGYTENVGVGGVALYSKIEVERFAHCQIHINIDAESEEIIQCDGKVMWAVPVTDAHGQHKHYDIGIEFSNLAEEKRKKIRDLVKRYPDLISQRKEK
jgi:hypothetical protein